MSKIIRSPEDHLARLQKEAAAMEAAVPLTQAAHSKAKRARERAQGEREAALKRVRALSVCASAARVTELTRAEGEAELAIHDARLAAEDALDDVHNQVREMAHQRKMCFLAASETERWAIAARREDFWADWEASDGRDREKLQLGWILANEPSIEELGWSAASDSIAQ
jgi:hypothetical protein